MILIFVADYHPELKMVQEVATIGVAFVGPFLMIYATARSSQGANVQLLLTLLLAMVIALLSYSDIYVRSGLIVDTSDAAHPHVITNGREGIYFSAVTWTTLGLRRSSASRFLPPGGGE